MITTQKRTNRTKISEEKQPESCFEQSREPVLGVSFERRNGTRMFIPYALLSTATYRDAGSIELEFASGVVGISGKNLDPLWEVLCDGKLKRVRESPAKCSSETEIEEITFPQHERYEGGASLPANLEPL